MREVIILTVLVIFTISAKCQPTGYTYNRDITIDGSQVSGTSPLNDYIFYFTFSDVSLRTVANGGRIENVNGYDIVFYDDNSGLPLKFQIESYDPLNGSYSAYILLTTLDPNDPPALKMYYANSSIITSQEDNSVWPNEFISVYNFTSSGAADDTPGTDDGTYVGEPVIADDMFGEAVCLDQADDYVAIPDQSYSDGTDDGFTLTFWFNVSDLTGTNFQYIFSHGTFGSTNSLNVFFIEDAFPTASLRGVLRTVIQDGNDSQDVDNLDIPSGLADGNWHQYTFVQASGLSGVAVYIDGVRQAEDLLRGNIVTNPTGNIFFGARNDLDANRYASGKFDHLRIQNTQKSEDFINTTYRNMSSPGTFYSVSSEALPVEWGEIKLTESNKQISISWSTMTEINNHYFEILRSNDGTSWKVVGSITGAGNSTEMLNYQFLDSKPGYGINYYRIKQVDYDSESSLSPIVKIRLDLPVSIYPNPSSDFLIIDFPLEFDIEKIELMNNMTSKVEILIHMLNKNRLIIDIRSLAPGLYYLKYGHKSWSIIRSDR